MNKDHIHFVANEWAKCPPELFYSLCRERLSDAVMGQMLLTAFRLDPDMWPEIADYVADTCLTATDKGNAEAMQYAKQKLQKP